MLTDKIKKVIEAAFLNQRYIDYVLLFGSSAVNKLNSNSDIDIFVGGRLSFEKRAQIMADLQGQLKRNIDIVQCQDAHNDVALTAFSKGIKIFVKNEQQLKEDYFKHYYAYEDALYLRQIKSARLNRVFHG